MREFLLERIAGLVEDRYGEDIREPAASALDRAAQEIVGAARPTAAATSLARRGYLARRAETELFAAARGAVPELAAALDEPGPGAAALARVAGELARAEPAERPDPAHEGAFSWRVPGPGGHVRHYLALGAVRREGAQLAGAKEGDLKRCWLYGFYVRCCEEASGD